MDGGWRHLPSPPDSVFAVTAPLAIIVLVFGDIGSAFMTHLLEASPHADAPDDGDKAYRPGLRYSQWTTCTLWAKYTNR